jgi:hypothetical protein
MHEPLRRIHAALGNFWNEVTDLFRLSAHGKCGRHVIQRDPTKLITFRKP